MTKNELNLKIGNWKVSFINWLIKKLHVDTNHITDGYHTFHELYEHRCTLWILLCQTREYKERCWKTEQHSDGGYWPGWFLLGMDKQPGKQKTYHLPVKYFKDVKVDQLEKAPAFDFHSSQDVLQRLKKMI